MGMSPLVSAIQAQQLVGTDKCREILFPDKPSAPGKRTFLEWQARGYFPVVKIGRRVFLDPEQVRAALERRFKINATSAV